MKLRINLNHDPIHRSLSGETSKKTQLHMKPKNISVFSVKVEYMTHVHIW
jgi:hypothetical protein